MSETLMSALPHERPESLGDQPIDGFGPPTRVFRPTGWNASTAVLVNTLVYGGGIAAALYLLSLGWSPLSCLVPAAGFALLGAGLRGWYAGRTDERVLLCPEGFIEVTAQAVRACRWDEIEAVFESPNEDGPAPTCVVHTSHGERFVFSRHGLDEGEALAELIQRELCRRLFAPTLDACRRGEMLTFGPVTLTAAGLRHGDETLAWGTIDRVHAGEGFIRIRREDRWVTWEQALSGDIPNLLLFLTVVEAIVAQHHALR
jgi:hypothetical protein